MQADKVNESDTEKSMDSFTPHMPPEVLQMVLHELDFFGRVEKCHVVSKSARPGCSQGDSDDKENSGDHEFPRSLLLVFNLEAREGVVGPRNYMITSTRVICQEIPLLQPWMNSAPEAITVHPMIKELSEYLHIIFGSLIEVGIDKQQRHHKYYIRNNLMAAIEAFKKTAEEKNVS
ncbi:hypothetical protein COCSADRAFT_29066 [Bipolaris sorokiniana ND90Pr]|uniref:Uncharacterized protein n=1 Tax=Cochliobolus sativus (strain ND90Pr / ATCC 201652) TaxID=665912 RepID=M2SH67_COCSN|nr:uncharacterized protein COCSADRAFT_29066 [Bipolaris sorokiniana ND90Pr]EMD61755.1 hypothetical protein COCSADRAFT_29066 [Bipolaris sorokiniana ND90Pr]